MAVESTPLDPALCAPSQNRFTPNVTNRFFPLPVGQKWFLVGPEDQATVGLRITVREDKEAFFHGRHTVYTRVVEEREWNDVNANGSIDRGEPLNEVSINYFAQTREGTVCYFGEHVNSYENGKVAGHEGSWRADSPGNAPGIFMPANPTPGMTFQQEFAPGIAEDQVTITGTGSVTVPAGTFVDTITAQEFNPLENATDSKVYAKDVGTIVDDTLELVRVRYARP